MGKRKEEPKEIPVTFAGDEPVEDQKATEPEELSGVEAEIVTPSADPPVTGEGKQEGELSVAELLGDIAELTQALNDAREQIDALGKEKSTLYDQVLRRQAELENNRKRLERDKLEFYQRVRGEVLLELLPVLDNFDRALLSLERSEGDAEALRHGVELIHKQLKGALTKLGLQPLEAVGKAFDPNLHEAVTVEPTSEHQENTVIEEIERGYKLGDRLLRPAKVKVATSPES
jgi:molecular chaperone GrpE